MLQNISTFLETAVYFLEFFFEYIMETVHVVYLAILYVVEAVVYIFGITPLIPYNLVIVFMAMIVLSIVFLIFGRVK